MLLQNIRAKIGARLSGEGEAGFTLIELLVVMLILGILAAIAIPSFFNQKSKANDSSAKETAHTAQIAMETCGTEYGAQYDNCTEAKLKEIEPTLAKGDKLTVAEHEKEKYEVTIESSTGDTFSIKRAEDGGITFPCTGIKGGCPGATTATPSGTWNNEA